MTLNFELKLNFELDMKQLFGFNFDPILGEYRAEFELSSQLEDRNCKKVTNNDIEFRTEIEFRARYEIDILFQYDPM